MTLLENKYGPKPGIKLYFLSSVNKKFLEIYRNPFNFEFGNCFPTPPSAAKHLKSENFDHN